MQYDVIRTDTFLRAFKSAHKKFPKSVGQTDKFIDNLEKKNFPGDVYPGFAPRLVKKARLSLKAYNIGKRKGLRLTYLVIHEKFKIIPIHIYKKDKYKEEAEVKAAIKANIESILEELP